MASRIPGRRRGEVVIVLGAPGGRRVALEGARHGGEVLHDGRLLAVQVARLEVVRRLVEARQDARRVLVLGVGAAVLGPGVLVLAGQHLVDGEEAPHALCAQDLLPGHQGVAAPGLVHARGQLEAAVADVADERMLVADLALHRAVLVLAHEIAALAVAVPRHDGEAEVLEAAEDLFDAQHLTEVVLGGHDLGELAAEELHPQLVAQSLGVSREAHRRLVELVRLRYVHAPSLSAVVWSLLTSLTPRCIGIPDA